jgi:hypothetical protein
MHDLLVVFYYLSASEIWPDKRGGSDIIRGVASLKGGILVVYCLRAIFPIHHTCMTYLFSSFLLIYKTRPKDFDLQLGCCISDAFSFFFRFQKPWDILKLVLLIRYLQPYKFMVCPICLLYAYTGINVGIHMI